MADIEQIKKLRDETGLSISECRSALEKSGGEIGKAKDVLKKLGKDMAEKKAQRTTEQGIVDSYIHPTKKLGVLLELGCETDFAAKSADFQSLAHEICLQIAGFQDEETSLLEQPWIKDQTKTIKNLVEECVAKVGENIVIKRFIRYQI